MCIAGVGGGGGEAGGPGACDRPSESNMDQNAVKIQGRRQIGAKAKL